MQPLSVQSKLPEEIRMPATAAPPFHGGTLVRGGSGKSGRVSGTLADLRETFTEGLDEFPRPVVPSRGWLRTFFSGRKSPQRADSQVATKQPPGSRGPSTVVPPTPSIFAEQPRGDVLQASARSVKTPVKGAVAQAVHSSPVADAGRSTGTQQTQHRSLRDGHNKPGSLFDPHAWVAPAWLAEPSGR